MFSSPKVLALLALVLCAAPATLAGYCMPFTHSLCWPRFKDVDTWRASLSKGANVLSPNLGDFAEYMSAAAGNLNMLYTTAPGFIVYPATEADIIKTVKFASKHKLRYVIITRGGQDTWGTKDLQPACYVSSCMQCLYATVYWSTRLTTRCVSAVGWSPSAVATILTAVRQGSASSRSVECIHITYKSSL